jgi:hypothetical protein
MRKGAWHCKAAVQGLLVRIVRQLNEAGSGSRPKLIGQRF